MSLDLLGSLLVAALGGGFGLMCVFGAGVWLARWAWPMDEPALARLSVPILSVAFASVWLNAAGRMIGWWAAVIGLAVIGVTGGIVYFRSASSLFFCRWRTCREALIWFVIFFVISLCAGIFDERWHFPLSALIAHGSWPARFPFDPLLPLSYHYGYDIVVAFLSVFRSYVPFVSDLLTACLQTMLVACVYRAARTYDLSPWRARLVTILTMATGTLAWIARPFRTHLPAEFTHVFPFHGSMVNSIFLTTFTKSTVLAWILLLFTIILLKRTPNIFDGVRGAMLIALMAAAMALSSETVFVIFVPALLIVYLLAPTYAWAPWKRSLMVVVMAVIVVLQGGLLTDLVQHALHLGSPTVAGPSNVGFVFGWVSQHQTFEDPISWATPAGWLRAVLELGAYGFLAVLACAGWIKRGALWERTVIVCAVIGLALPLVVHYAELDREMLRLWTSSFLVTNFFGSLTLVRLAERRRWVWTLVPLFTFSGFASLALSTIPVTWMASFEPTIASRALWLPYLRHQTTLPLGSVVWTGEAPVEGVVENRVREIPVAFAAYAQSCQDLFNHVVQPSCVSLSAHPTVDGLHALGITHALLSDAFLQQHHGESWMTHLHPLRDFTDPSAPFTWMNRIPGRAGSLHLYQVMY